MLLVSSSLNATDQRRRRRDATRVICSPNYLQLNLFLKWLRPHDRLIGSSAAFCWDCVQHSHPLVSYRILEHLGAFRCFVEGRPVYTSQLELKEPRVGGVDCMSEQLGFTSAAFCFRDCDFIASLFSLTYCMCSGWLDSTAFSINTILKSHLGLAGMSRHSCSSCGATSVISMGLRRFVQAVNTEAEMRELSNIYFWKKETAFWGRGSKTTATCL